MPHVLKSYTELPTTLTSFSSDMLAEHVKLYEGYVGKYNEIETALASVEKKGNYSYAPHSELTRRKSVAWNGVILHELYFDALTAMPHTITSTFETKLVEYFGSVDAWKQDLVATASATPGWAILVEHRGSGKLEHFMVFEHQNNMPAQVNIILALDCWEHAFAKQFGINKAAYLEAFFTHLDFSVVENRLQS